MIDWKDTRVVDCASALYQNTKISSVKIRSSQETETYVDHLQIIYSGKCLPVSPMISHGMGERPVSLLEAICAQAVLLSSLLGGL